MVSYQVRMHRYRLMCDVGGQSPPISHIISIPVYPNLVSVFCRFIIAEKPDKQMNSTLKWVNRSRRDEQGKPALKCSNASTLQRFLITVVAVGGGWFGAKQ
jgi:hypothetical protein